MKFKVTQGMIDQFKTGGSYWFTRFGNSMGFSSGSGDPICAAITEKTGRQSKMEYWPVLKVGILTSCKGGFYMFDLPPEVIEAGKRQTNGVFMLDREVEFELPGFDEQLEKEAKYDAEDEARRFAYAI